MVGRILAALTLLPGGAAAVKQSHQRKIYSTAEVAELRQATMCSHNTNSCSPCIQEFVRAMHGEDRILLRTLLLASEMIPGTFVEIGAFDGDSFSNTLMLERCYNWTGLLVEGDPNNFAMLKKSSRQAAKVHAAACEHSAGHSTIPFLVPTAVVGKETYFSPTSAQLDSISKDFKEMWLQNQSTEIVEVPCMPLRSMMRKHGFDDGMTFLSLDVEGAEDKVLATVDPLSFRVVLVEWAADGHAIDATNTSKNGRVHERLVSAGMGYYQTLALGPARTGGFNRVYLHPSLATHPLLMSHNKFKYVAPCLDAVEARARQEGHAAAELHSATSARPHPTFDDRFVSWLSLHCSGAATDPIKPEPAS